MGFINHPEIIHYLVVNYARIVNRLVHPIFFSEPCPTYPIEITRVNQPPYDLWDEPPGSLGIKRGR